MLVNRESNLDELAAEAYYCATANGFHENDDGSLNEMFARLMLIVTEVAEIAEELRKPDFDPEKVDEEVADIIIRVLDFAAAYGCYSVADAVISKMEKNRNRPRMHGKRI